MLLYSTKRRWVDDLCSFVAGALVGNSRRQKTRLLVIGITWRHFTYMSDVNYDGCQYRPTGESQPEPLHMNSCVLNYLTTW